MLTLLKSSQSRFHPWLSILHKNAYYDFADDLYLRAVSKGCLPWPVIHNENKQLTFQEIDSTDIYSIHKTDCNEPLLLDLHGMTVAIAHSAVRTALQKEVQRTLLPSDHQAWCHDVIIITGKGNNSAHRLRPVLRPEVQRMLTEEFYPPLSTISVPNNIGALQILAKDVDSWLDYQKRQRSARLLAVANLLKSFAGGSRLRESIRKNFAKE